MVVELAAITRENLVEVMDLSVRPDQEHLVASNARSLAQSYVEHERVRPRAITADGDIVGFLLLGIDPDDDDGQPFWLWRLMIDARHQGCGHGTGALAAAVEYVRELGAAELFTSWVPGDDGPEGFYLGLGFAPTGEVDDGEVVARLDLTG